MRLSFTEFGEAEASSPMGNSNDLNNSAPDPAPDSAPDPAPDLAGDLAADFAADLALGNDVCSLSGGEGPLIPKLLGDAEVSSRKASSNINRRSIIGGNR